MVSTLKERPDSDSPVLKYSKLENVSALFTTADSTGSGIAFCGSEEVFFASITIGSEMMVMRAKIFGTAIFILDVRIRVLKTVAIAAYCICFFKKRKSQYSLDSVIRILDKTGMQRYPSTCSE
jgi:hypothetical protein